MSSLTLRVRTPIGTWRVSNVPVSENFKYLRARLEQEHNAILGKNCFSLDPSGNQVIHDEVVINDAHLANGHMIYAMVEESKVSVHTASTSKKIITKDGKIMHLDSETALKSTGFRPGMLPLRSMKMHWTLNEFMSLDEQFVYKVKSQEKSVCTKATIDATALSNFQNYIHQFGFRSMRIGYLYGKFEEDNKVKVEVIYEPPQETTDVDFKLLEDPKEHSIEVISHLLGLQKVGWIFAHPPREKGFHFSGPEILFAAEQQLEAAQGINDTPFVTMKATLDHEKGQAVIEAFQVSKQCMEMVAEGVLQVSHHLGNCTVNSTFTAVVEGKESPEVDNNFFLATTPIEQFKSHLLVNMFPVGNRIDTMQTRDDIKKQLKKVGKEGWTFIDMLADFHLLLYLSEFLDVEQDLPRVCKSILDRDVKLDAGYELLIRSIAGMDM